MPNINVITEADKQGRRLITRAGHPVNILMAGANSKYPIVGIIRYPLGDKAVQWKKNGRSTAIESEDLVMWDHRLHFPWGDLPSWANFCIYRAEYTWFCSSCDPLEGNSQAVSLVLPQEIIQQIGLTEHRDGTILYNPKYDHGKTAYATN